VLGFILSFTFFTLTLSAIVRATGLSAEGLRTIAVFVITLFGFSLLLPAFQLWMEHALSSLAGFTPTRSQHSGFIGGIIVGLSLGLLWAPCVGPILASVITIAATSKISAAALFITLAYSCGTAIPMFGIIYGGRSLLNSAPWLASNTGRIQKLFGIAMILMAFALYFNLDRKFQTYILQTFPNYGVGLTKFEDNAVVTKALQQLTKKPMDTTHVGKPMNDVMDDSFGNAPDLIPGGQWINLPTGQQALSMKELRGKVVLVDFWTYTCINCIRTLPYIKAWNEKYKDKGLVIIGVHTPEFAFEHEASNVQKAVKDFDITYPVMQDNDYATWNAYDNHYWPAKYLIDKNGKIRDTHFGEGNYNETEMMIQKLLEETGIQITEKPNNKEYAINAGSPESYLGYERIQYFASPEPILKDKPATYTIPDAIKTNTFAYGGSWTVGAERAMAHTGASLVYRFNAGNVYLVMRPVSQQGGLSTGGRVKIYLDGKSVDTASAGKDVQNGIVTIDKDRLYELIKLAIPGSHELRLEFLDGGIEAFAFTFG
jgi:cytochrome c biogenesis protein CcdA/thiol-disulfide isomerase/thioredoxin